MTATVVTCMALHNHACGVADQGKVRAGPRPTRARPAPDPRPTRARPAPDPRPASAPSRGRPVLPSAGHRRRGGLGGLPAVLGLARDRNRTAADPFRSGRGTSAPASSPRLAPCGRSPWPAVMVRAPRLRPATGSVRRAALRARRAPLRPLRRCGLAGGAAGLAAGASRRDGGANTAPIKMAVAGYPVGLSRSTGPAGLRAEPLPDFLEPQSASSALRGPPAPWGPARAPGRARAGAGSEPYVGRGLPLRPGHVHARRPFPAPACGARRDRLSRSVHPGSARRPVPSAALPSARAGPRSGPCGAAGGWAAPAVLRARRRQPKPA